VQHLFYFIADVWMSKNKIK